jgi:hypothetical protein
MQRPIFYSKSLKSYSFYLIKVFKYAHEQTLENVLEILILEIMCIAFIKKSYHYPDLADQFINVKNLTSNFRFHSDQMFVDLDEISIKMHVYILIKEI